MSQPHQYHPPMLVMALSAALIALTVSYSVDAEPLDTQKNTATLADAPYATAAFEPPTLAPSAIVLNGASAYRVEQGVIKLFFFPSKTDIPVSADRALEELAQAVKKGQRIQIAGFHDETGNPLQNMTLSKKRAEMVQRRLIALGAPSRAISVKKPAVGSTDGNHAEARRVEIAMLP